MGKCKKKYKKKGPDRNRTGDLGKAVSGELQSHALPLSHEPLDTDWIESSHAREWILIG